MNICYRVCNSFGWSKFDTLADLDTYLSRNMARGFAFSPIKRIVKVVSEDVPLTETVRKYNDMATKKKGETK